MFKSKFKHLWSTCDEPSRSLQSSGQVPALTCSAVCLKETVGTNRYPSHRGQPFSYKNLFSSTGIPRLPMCLPRWPSTPARSLGPWSQESKSASRSHGDTQLGFVHLDPLADSLQLGMGLWAEPPLNVGAHNWGRKLKFYMSCCPMGPASINFLPT